MSIKANKAYIPNLLTTGNLFCGFLAIISSISGEFERIIWLIFIAMLLDTMDGRIARITHTQSNFGLHYDSLADIVSFGVAPAIFIYNLGLLQLGKIGWLIAFFYVATTALRLSRFNVDSLFATENKDFFRGLPCPVAAVVLSGVSWLIYSWGGYNLIAIYISVVLMILLGLLMVSNISYRNFKESKFKNHYPHLANLCIVALFIIIALKPILVLTIIFCLYSFIGALIPLMKKFRFFTTTKIKRRVQSKIIKFKGKRTK